MSFTKSTRTVRAIVFGLKFLTVATAAHIFPSICVAAVIYGGPTNAPAPGIEYRSPSPPLSGSSAGNGAAVGNVQKSTNGVSWTDVAVRWDTTGASAVELGYLGTAAGFGYSRASEINTAGTAVGDADKFVAGTNVGRFPVRWNSGETVATELELPSPNGFSGGVASAINEAGTVVGQSRKYSSSGRVNARAVRWDAGSNVGTELGDLGTAPNGETEIAAYAVNAAGVTVGIGYKYVNGNSLGQRAIRWDAGSTTATELGNLGTSSSGSTFSNAIGVDDSGNVFGYANKFAADGTFLGFRPIRWDAGSTVPTELDDLLETERYANCYPLETNSYGTIVGTATKYVGGVLIGSRAVRWDAGGVAITELGSLGPESPGITHSIAYDVNDAGIAVGDAPRFSGATYLDTRAVLWGADAVAVDLNTLLSPSDASLWSLRYAAGISNTGWITGLGTFDPDCAAGPLAGYDRIFLMQIPEPVSALLLTSASVLFLGRTLRSKKRFG